MKKLINALISFWLVLNIAGLFAATTGADSLIVDTAATHFQVSLPANPTTGYQWVLKQYDKAMIKLVRSEYQPAHSKLIGAPGNMVFYFKVLRKAVKNQRTQMGFEYARPWENKKTAPKIVIIKFK